MKFKFKTQPYQQEAVENICKVFDGQPYMDMVRYTRDLGIKKTSNIVQTSIFDYYEKDDNGFENAKILLNEYQILENIKEIQKANNYKISCFFTILIHKMFFHHFKRLFNTFTNSNTWHNNNKFTPTINFVKFKN